MQRPIRFTEIVELHAQQGIAGGHDQPGPQLRLGYCREIRDLLVRIVPRGHGLGFSFLACLRGKLRFSGRRSGA